MCTRARAASECGECVWGLEAEASDARRCYRRSSPRTPYGSCGEELRACFAPRAASAAAPADKMNVDGERAAKAGGAATEGTATFVSSSCDKAGGSAHAMEDA